jgi:hypothetical protein
VRQAAARQERQRAAARCAVLAQQDRAVVGFGEQRQREVEASQRPRFEESGRHQATLRVPVFVETALAEFEAQPVLSRAENRPSPLRALEGARPTAVATVRVRCRECRGSFDLAKRNEYGWRARGLEPVCRACRAAPAKPPSQRDRDYWLERFTLAEIREMAAGIWPPD